MTLITFVRHGQTDWNKQRRIQGRTDIPLNDIGRRQARDAGAALAALAPWDLIVSSPLGRARETAEIIGGSLDLASPLLIDGLAERAHGEMEGMTFDERQAAFPGDAVVPGLESREEVIERVLAALRASAQIAEASRVLAVTHGGVIGSLVRYATDGEQPTAGQLISNGSFHDFTWSDDSLELTTLRTVTMDRDLGHTKLPQR
ncbi:histidine phosphatase family protein [Paramicrobacterium sp. CJ85]|uniref:histidine phosphatase family protein n=1 Tax=Paramicrobacterium sp. CJ85 TaxID=3445355 RepID=UPI003F5F3F6B